MLVGCAPNAEQSRDAALRYFAEEVEVPDPSWSYLVPYLAGEYTTEIRFSSGLRFGPGPGGDRDALPTPAVYRRLLDPGASVDRQEIAELDSTVDRMLAVALHCDHLGVPESWLRTLRSAGDRGGYALTHAALAIGWTLENGCLTPADAGPLRSRLLGQLEELIDRRSELAARNPRASDIWIEALALFGYLGAKTRVRPEWLEALRALQRPDGGWPEHPQAENSSPHTTAFALWALLEALANEPAHSAMIPR